jgi:hypothetical protein
VLGRFKSILKTLLSMKPSANSKWRRPALAGLNNRERAYETLGSGHLIGNPLSESDASASVHIGRTQSFSAQGSQPSQLQVTRSTASETETRAHAALTSGNLQARHVSDASRHLLERSGLHRHKPLRPHASPIDSADDLQAQIQRCLLEIPNGLSARYLERMLGICRSHDMIIGIRPVNLSARYLIETLGYPTKPFHIKYKTEKTGPAAGHLLARNPDGTPRRVEPHALTRPLYLTGRRLEELRDIGALIVHTPLLSIGTTQHTQRLSSPDQAGGQWLARLREPEDKTYLEGFEEQGGIWKIFSVNPDDQTETSVDILAHPHLKKPITADYDLLTFGYRRSTVRQHASTQPPLHMDDISSLSQTRRAAKGRSVSASGSTSEQQREDPNWGNASDMLIRLANTLNAAINRGPGLQLIHHNADCDNPFSDERDIYPAIFLLPNPAATIPAQLRSKAPINSPEKTPGLDELLNHNQVASPWQNQGIVWVRNPSDLTSLYTEAWQHGYQIKRGPVWIGGGVIPPRNSDLGIG